MPGEPLFGTGSEPSSDPAAYPPFDEVLAGFRSLRTGTLKLVDQLGETGMDAAPKAVPPGFVRVMTTIGQTLHVIALHTMVHYGQITDARRVAGLKPLL